MRSIHVQVRAQVPSPGQGLLASCLLEPVANRYGAWPASGEVSRCCFHFRCLNPLCPKDWGCRNMRRSARGAPP